MQLGKKRSNNPLIFGILTCSLILLGTTANFIIRNSSSRVQLQELTVPVVKDNLTIKISASGKVEPIKSVNVSPKNPGRLVKLLVLKLTKTP